MTTGLDATQPQQRVRAYLLWLLVVTVTSEGLVAWSVTVHLSSALLFVLFELSVSWSPGIAALLTSWQLGRPLREMGWRLPSPRMFLIAYAIPLVYSLATYGFVWITGLGKFPAAAPLAAMTAKLGLANSSPVWALSMVVLHHGTVLWLRGCATSLGEEIGWRGFLLPELVKFMSFRRAVLFSGTVWAVWHFPLILFGGYHGHNQMIFSMACFTLVIIAMSFPLSWLRLKSGEVWTCTAFHASHNLFILKLFGPLTEDTGPTRWLVSEFGIVTVIMTWITAWCFRRINSGGSDAKTISA